MSMPDSLNIQITSQIAMTATTTYRIHWPAVFGSVRFAISTYTSASFDSWILGSVANRPNVPQKIGTFLPSTRVDSRAKIAVRMDQAFFIAAAVFFGLVALAQWIYHLASRKKLGKREVGYMRREIEVNAAAVPEFKPTWRDLQDKGEAR
jgi:hypothetical protein